MEQEQSNNDDLIVKDYRETGQATGIIGKITLSCNLGEIGLNVFRDEQGIIKPSQQSMILTNIERRIVETHGTEKITKVVVDYIIKNFKHQENTEDKKFRYMLLDRLKQDCQYYLGYGNRNPKNLWAGNVKDQILKMKELYNSFLEDEKPEWLSMEDIETYEKKMKETIDVEEVEGKLDVLLALVNTMKSTYNDLPLKFRKELKDNYSENNPQNIIYELERSINYWIRNSESVIDELEEN